MLRFALVFLVSAILLPVVFALGPSQQGSPCVWVEMNDSAVQECIEWASNGCTDCCLHEHMPMNWTICVQGGDELKDPQPNKYFNAIDRTCSGSPNYYCDQVSGPAPCEHYKKECKTVECP